MDKEQDELQKQIKELQKQRAQSELAFGVQQKAEFDQLYSAGRGGEEYVDFIADDTEEFSAPSLTKNVSSYTAPQALLDEMEHATADGDKELTAPSRLIAEREDSYRKQWRSRQLLPVVDDPYARATGKSKTVSGLTYKEINKENILIREEAMLNEELARREREEKELKRREERRREAEEQERLMKKSKKEKRKRKHKHRKHRKHSNSSNSSNSSDSSSSSSSSGEKEKKKPKTEQPKVLWQIVVLKEGKSLTQYQLTKETELRFGRSEDSDVVLAHMSCSSVHAKLKVGSDSIPQIIDMNSTNGTFVNKQQIKPAAYWKLKDRDIIRFGESTREYMMMFVNV